jgi:hypothetical protein
MPVKSMIKKYQLAAPKHKNKKNKKEIKYNSISIPSMIIKNQLEDHHTGKHSLKDQIKISMEISSINLKISKTWKKYMEKPNNSYSPSTKIHNLPSANTSKQGSFIVMNQM